MVTVAPARLYANLELLRFLAALSILAMHYNHFAFIGYDSAGLRYFSIPLEAQPFQALLLPLYYFGFYAVQLFWLLSGFIFFSQYLEKLSARQVSLPAFAVRRIARLWPLYFTTAALCFGLQHLYHSLTGSYFMDPTAHLWSLSKEFLMAGRWLPPFSEASLNSPAWSVSIEVIAYAVFALVACWGFRSRKASKITAILVVGFSLTVVILLPYQRGGSGQIVEALGLFFLGGVGFWCTQTGYFQRHREILVAGGLMIGLVLGLSLTYGAHSTHNPWILDDVPGYFMLLQLACFFFVVAVAEAPEPTGRSKRLMIFLGSLTYAVYLLHYPLQIAISSLFAANGLTVPAGEPALLLSWVGLTLGLAFLTHKYFELPAQRTLRKLGASTIGKPDSDESTLVK